MDNSIIAIMLSVSIFMGLLGLIAVLWGIKNNQFDDEKKWMQGILIDDINELNEAYKKDKDERNL